MECNYNLKHGNRLASSDINFHKAFTQGVVVGEAPCLSQTGYKAYGYLPWAMITLSRTCDANWRPSRFVTNECMMPVGVYRV